MFHDADGRVTAATQRAYWSAVRRCAEYLLDMHGGIFATLAAATSAGLTGEEERHVRAEIRRQYIARH